MLRRALEKFSDGQRKKLVHLFIHELSPSSTAAAAAAAARFTSRHVCLSVHINAGHEYTRPSEFVVRTQ